ncbi:MAG: long-chain fatty acid--CoA ligase [Myxococcales bacterium]|nr:long-chain fatty acid--CoA ligase [Myxococcales bacterium]
MAADTIPSRLLEQARLRPSGPAYKVRENGVWKATSWATYADEVKRAGRALITLGIEPGEHTCILGFNRPEWVIFDVATMAVGGAPAGIYTTSSPEEVQYIVHHAEAKVVLVENAAQWEKIKAQRENLPALRTVVLMKGAPRIDDPLVLSWEAFLAKADETSEEKLLQRIHALEPEGLAQLIYTSGTTGPPKAVMLTHRNLAWTAKKAQEITALTAADTTLSYLPLSHIAEQMFSIHGAITTGICVYFAESIEAVPENLKEVQPTVFFGVPRIWEKFHAGISAKLDEATGVKAKLVKWAMSVGRRVNALRGQGKKPQGLLAAEYELANRLIFSKLKEAIGLKNARIAVSGAAPIAKEVLEFFAALDIVVLEVYGQSEDTGPTSFNLPNRFRFGSVGPAVSGVEVKIAEDGEVLVKGPNVFKGYLKDEAATKDTLVDGWLHSGDLGEFREGFLYITGRKKDIIITAGGKNIAPKNLEAALKNHELVNEAVVIGDRRKYLTALVTLDPERVAAMGIDPKTAHQDETVRASIQAHLDEINKQFARVEQIKKFTILERNFSIEDGELTPTLKVKRNRVNEHFADAIEAMYED